MLTLSVYKKTYGNSATDMIQQTNHVPCLAKKLFSLLRVHPALPIITPGSSKNQGAFCLSLASRLMVPLFIPHFQEVPLCICVVCSQYPLARAMVAISLPHFTLAAQILSSNPSYFSLGIVSND